MAMLSAAFIHARLRKSPALGGAKEQARPEG